MSLTTTELKNLQTACANLPEGKDYRCDDFIENLLLTVLDFQMHVEVVGSSLLHFRKQCGFKTMAKLEDTLQRFPDTEPGNLKLAKHLWGNGHWTRVKFLRVIVAKFGERGVRDQVALRRWAEKAEFERDVRGQFRSSNHSIGYTLFQWLRLRCGLSAIKPDLHVRRFVETAIRRKPSPDETVKALIKISKMLRRKPYRLDSAIWQHQKDLS